MNGNAVRNLKGNQYGAGGRLLPDPGPVPTPTAPPQFDGDGNLIPPAVGYGLGSRSTSRQALVQLPIPIAGVIQWQLVAPFNPTRNYLLLQNQTGGLVIQVSFKNPISLTQDLGILIPSGGNYELNVWVPPDPVYVATLSTAATTSNLTVIEG